MPVTRDSVAKSVEDMDSEEEEELLERGGDLLLALKLLSKDSKKYYLGNGVQRVSEAPKSPFDFYRRWVSRNVPVVFEGAARHWPAFRKWQENDYLRRKVGDREVTVSATPTGYADAMHRDGDGRRRFVTPHEEKMKVSDFLDALENPKDGLVYYCQMQNSNLTDPLEWSDLFKDVEEPEWAGKAFETPPDAVNFWMGDERAVTSTHRDPYENVYCVVRGHKDVILFPPFDLPWLKYESCRPARFSLHGDGQFTVEDREGRPVPWISVDPLNPDPVAHPEYANASPMRVRLDAGDILYLPSQWFHHLRQSQGCIAVNFWYDMAFDGKFVANRLVRNIAKLVEHQKSDC